MPETLAAGWIAGGGQYAAAMANFAVRLVHGPGWDAARPIRSQDGWDEHAAFMDALVDDGFVVLGGPLADEERVVLVVAADDEQTVRERLAQDPWSGTHLVVESVDAWTIRLDGRARAG